MTLKFILTRLLTTCALASPLLAEGDIKSGKKVFKKCKACHAVKADKNKVGPTLYKIVDAPSGSVEGFKYSDEMAAANLVWDDATLGAFLAKPKDVVPGTSMAFPGLKKQSQIDDVIAYLRDVAQD